MSKFFDKYFIWMCQSSLLTLWMANTEQLIDFLKKHKQYFRINDIERTTEIPQSTINRAMAGRGNLTPNQEKKIIGYLRLVRTGLERLFEK